MARSMLNILNDHVSQMTMQISSPLEAYAFGASGGCPGGHHDHSRRCHLHHDQTLARAAASIDIRNRSGHWEIRCHLASFFASTRHIQTNISNFPREFLTAGLTVMQLNLILQISMKALAWLDILENFTKVMTVLCF